TWREVHVEADGVPTVADEILKKNPPTATISGNDISATEDPKGPAAPFKFSGRFHLDPTKQPKAIDFFYLDGDAKPMLGIYRLDGDTLTLCWNTEPTKPGDRPTEFSTKGKKWTLAVWQRVVNAGRDGARRSDQESIQGTWKAVSASIQGPQIEE